jgi:cytochrome c peroxidase
MLGLIVIPARRRSAKKELTTKINELRNQLVSTLETQFEKEINQSINKITDAMAPYTRFIKSEHRKFDEEKSELDRIQKNLNQVKANIEMLQ